MSVVVPIARERFVAGPEVRTKTIVAPPGYGKTAMVATLAGRGEPVSVQTLDPADNDAGRLWARVLAAVRALHPSLAPRTEGVARMDPYGRVASVPTLAPLHADVRGVLV